MQPQPQPRLAYPQQVRQAVSDVSRLVFLYSLAMFVFVFLISIVMLMVFMSSAMPASAVLNDSMKQQYIGIVSVISVLCCMGFLRLLTHREPLWRHLPYEMRQELSGRGERASRRMSPEVFAIALMLVLAVSDIYGLLQSGLGWHSHISVSSMQASPATETSVIDLSVGSICLLLYEGLLGPIVEELLFRGLVMPKLARFGRVFSIVVSAVLFGVFHTDFLQGSCAILVGLVLGYVATEYGIAWSIVLHITNNLVFANLLPRLLLFAPTIVRNICDYGLDVVVIAGTVLYLVLRRDRIRGYVHANASAPGTCSAAWSAPWFVALSVISIALACTGLV